MFFVHALVFQGTSYPFMAPEDQDIWKAECCVEQNILRGSEREVMCESVLSSESKRQQYSKQDLQPMDKGIASYLGEDEELVWTEEGVQSSLGGPAWAQEGKVVNNGFLRFQPLTVQEGLKWGYWKVKKKGGWFPWLKFPWKKNKRQKTHENEKESGWFSKLGFKRKSLLETSARTQCDLNNLKTCTKQIKKTKQKACTEEGQWSKVTEIVEDRGVCKRPNPVFVKVPEECTKAEFKNAGAIRWHYFQFKEQKNHGDYPVECYVESKTYTCDAEPQKRIKDFHTVWFWKEAKWCFTTSMIHVTHVTDRSNALSWKKWAVQLQISYQNRFLQTRNNNAGLHANDCAVEVSAVSNSCAYAAYESFVENWLVYRSVILAW